MYSLYSILCFIKNNSPITYIKNYSFPKKFLNKPPIKLKMISKKSDLDIYIISFNSPQLILDQILFLKKNLKDNYRLIIVDNSNNLQKSNEIENICTKNQTSYIKLPKNNLKRSHSHALALNYTMKNIISKESAQYIGFLDHDCFLIKPISIINFLKKQKLYGKLMDYIPFKIFKHTYNISGKRWIIRPGCAFYDKTLFNKGYNFFPNKQLLPLSFLDTGGGNWKYIYKNFKKENLILLNHKPDNKIKGADNFGNIFIHLGGAGYRDHNTINGMQQELYDFYS